MRLSVDWEKAGRTFGDIDLLAVGVLRFFIGDTNVCESRAGDNGTMFEAIPVSVYPLAEGLAMDWWSLFGSRDVPHPLIAYRGGYALPDVRLRFDGSDFEAACSPSRHANRPVHFLNDAVERMGRAEAESALGDFLDDTVARVEAGGAREFGLQAQWRLVQASRADPEEAAFCEAAGALGIDPYDITEAGAAFVERSGALFGGEPLAEFLTGLRSIPQPNDALDWILEAEQRPAVRCLLPAIGDMRNGAPDGHAVPGEGPSARGYRWARTARRALGAAQNERFRSVRALARRLGMPGFLPTPPTAGIRALVDSRDGETRIHLGRANNPRGNLFALARAVGEAVANPPARRAAVNDLREASRQACARAFAAEFLAPVDEILSMRRDGYDVHSIAREFGVLTGTVERQEGNADRIRRASAA